MLWTFGLYKFIEKERNKEKKILHKTQHMWHVFHLSMSMLMLWTFLLNKFIEKRKKEKRNKDRKKEKKEKRKKQTNKQTNKEGKLQSAYTVFF